MAENIEEKVMEIITKHFGKKASEVTPDTLIIEQLGADSLHRIELIMQLEDKFGINIPDEDADKIKSVGDVINFIKNKS